MTNDEFERLKKWKKYYANVYERTGRLKYYKKYMDLFIEINSAEQQKIKQEILDVPDTYVFSSEQLEAIKRFDKVWKGQYKNKPSKCQLPVSNII